MSSGSFALSSPGSTDLLPSFESVFIHSGFSSKANGVVLPIFPGTGLPFLSVSEDLQATASDAFVSKVCDSRRWEFCRVCGQDFRRAWDGGWEALHCLERGELSFYVCWNLMKPELVIYLLVFKVETLTLKAVAPYERPALTKGYVFPLDKMPARLPGFHTCVGSGGERQTAEWYKEQGIELQKLIVLYENMLYPYIVLVNFTLKDNQYTFTFLKVFYEDPIVGLDIQTKTLTTLSGKLITYGSLIISTGCSASRLPGQSGGNLPGVHYIRDIADADLLVSSLENAKKVAIIGGGYIGMEVAAAAVGWNLDTTIIFPNDHLMPRLFTPALARRYEELYTKLGVRFLKGVLTERLEAGSDGRVSTVVLKNGTIVEADMVVVGIGAKPAVSPFELVGLNSVVGGIQVDGHFRTGVPGIFAVGDIAAFPLKVHIGETIEVGNFDPKVATFWIDSDSRLKGIFLESGNSEEFGLLPRLARAQPVVDKAKLMRASSVEDALALARSSLQAETIL
ncbi:Monodehydroascorbate reductase, chloroplastic [Apostasia shenzhenica]|uniref:monodehydroascorbate reductase (NADH) n=1 Tax=Apostasia shenzhenica TaxID=1088818 RepID=A0A2I0BES7_9ASPA|nr:Monodehydroascorbate reductase, chloroplastic [Apostasia shenzhenica]